MSFSLEQDPEERTALLIDDDIENEGHNTIEANADTNDTLCTATLHKNEEEKTIHFEQTSTKNDNWLKFTEMVDLKENRTESVQELDFRDMNAEISLNAVMEPLVDDYINCTPGYTTKCRAIKRILNILKYCSNELIHEYLLKFSNYSISIFMEDWYHCKKIHLIDQNDVEVLINNANIECVNDES
eukprot:185011_1